MMLRSLACLLLVGLIVSATDENQWSKIFCENQLPDKCSPRTVRSIISPFTDLIENLENKILAKKKILVQDKEAVINCQNDLVIQIVKASISNVDKTKCALNGMVTKEKPCTDIIMTTLLTQKLCNGKTECQLTVGKYYSSFCECSIQKYLDITYKCNQPSLAREDIKHIQKRYARLNFKVDEEKVGEEVKKESDYSHAETDRSGTETDNSENEEPLRYRNKKYRKKHNNKKYTVSKYKPKKYYQGSRKYHSNRYSSNKYSDDKYDTYKKYDHDDDDEGYDRDSYRKYGNDRYNHDDDDEGYDRDSYRKYGNDRYNHDERYGNDDDEAPWYSEYADEVYDDEDDYDYFAPTLFDYGYDYYNGDYDLYDFGPYDYNYGDYYDDDYYYYDDDDDDDDEDYYKSHYKRNKYNKRGGKYRSRKNNNRV